MMETTEIIVTVTIHRYERAKSGQARQLPGLRRWAARLNAWTVAWYVFLTVAGVLLYKLGAAYAMQERGYFAVGGEALALLLLLLLPVLYYCAAATVRDIIKDWRERR